MEVFDKLSSHLLQKLPFVLYSKPTSKKIVGLFQNNSDAYLATNIEDKGFVMNHFGDNNLWIIPENQSEIIVENFDFDENDKNERKWTVEFDNETSNREKYTTLVKKGIDAIKNNDFEKIVLARSESIYFDAIDIVKTFKNVFLHFPDSFRYIYYHPKFNCWCGAFSEKLLKIDGENFETMALAGTQKFDSIKNVEWQQKEITEQKFVTDYITAALQNKVSEIIVFEPITIQHGKLLHIKTDIFGKLNKNSDVFTLLKVLNPTPAVCGIPKEHAKEFILKNEEFSREFYAGVVGEINKDFEANENFKSELFVNLRCMKIKENQAVLFAGAGITKDSLPQKEWEETVNKTFAMKNCLNLIL